MCQSQEVVVFASQLDHYSGTTIMEEVCKSMSMNKRLFLIPPLIWALACSKVSNVEAPDDARARELSKAPEAPAEAPKMKEFPLPPPPPLPILADHAVFIGRPKYLTKLDCRTFDTPQAPHRQPGRELHDATEFPERYQVTFARAPLGGAIAEKTVPLAPSLGRYPASELAIAFALGRDAFMREEHRRLVTDYDASYCMRLEGLLKQPFVVTHAFPIYVDHGNGEGPPWGDWGTSLRMRNQGFPDLGSAQSYAKRLLEAQRGPNYQEPALKLSSQGKWHLMEVLGSPTPTTLRSTIEFGGDTISGSTGCNDYSASITWSTTVPSEFTLGPVTLGKENCEGMIHKWEENLVTALRAIKSGWFQDGDLILSHSNYASIRARRIDP